MFNSFLSNAILGACILAAPLVQAVAIPGSDFYRAMTLKIRPDGQFRIYMPDGKNQDVTYHFKFGVPIYKEPMVSDVHWDPPHKEFLRRIFDRISFADESYLEVGGERIPLTCVFIDGQDNRFAGSYNPLEPDLIYKIYLVANDYSCQGPIRPGWPASGGRKENWDTYMYYEVRDPTIMLPQDARLRFRWNEYGAVLLDSGNPP